MPNSTYWMLLGSIETGDRIQAVRPLVPIDTDEFRSNLLACKICAHSGVRTTNAGTTRVDLTRELAHVRTMNLSLFVSMLCCNDVGARTTYSDKTS